jgi:hypothetical protein
VLLWKKITVGIVACVAGVAAGVIALMPGASANNPVPYEGVSGAAAFENSPYGSVQNSNNTQLRFGPGGRIAIPGQAGDHANGSSAVAPYSTGGSGGIVNPPSANG